MLDPCSGLSDAQRKSDMGVFFKSIHGTFDHLIYGDLAWMGRFTGGPMPTKRIGEILHESWGSWMASGVPWTAESKPGPTR